MSEQSRVLPRWWGHLAALGGYLLFSLIILAPWLPRFGSAIFGGPVAQVDGWQNVWNLWWVQRALASGANPFYTPYLYYPTGVDLHLQTLNLTNGLLVFPVTALSGPIAGYNAAVLLAFVLAGLGGYALSLYITNHRLAAFAGGLVFAFSPFHMTKVWDGQLEMIALQWLPFYALFLVRAADRFRWWDAALAGLFLALIGYTSWYYLLFFAIYSVLFVALWLVTTPGWTRRRMLLRQMLVVGVVGGMLLAPILLPALSDVEDTTTRINPDSALDLILIHSANLFDFWLPSHLHPLWGATVEQLGQTWHPYIHGWNLAPGYGALALAVLGGVMAWRTAWRWWLLALAGMLLALGPLLHIGTLRTTLYLPYALLLNLPGVGIARRPSHFVIITVVLLAPLVALGVRWLLERVAASYRPLLLAGIVVLLAFEYAPPRWPLIPPAVHPYYAALRGHNGALLDLPPRNESSGPLQAQMVHERPMLGGFVSRTPPYPFVARTPGVRQLWALRPEAAGLLPTDPPTALAALNFYDIQHIVVHWDLVEPGQRAGLEAVIAQTLPGVAPVYSDDHVSAYRVPQAQPQPFAYFGTGWYPEEGAAGRTWRWMQDAGELVLVNPSEEAIAVTLRLRMQSYLEPRTVDLALDQQAVGQWQVPPAEAIYTLQVLLPPGEHRLSLQAPVSREQHGERQISIVIVGVELLWS